MLYLALDHFVVVEINSSDNHLSTHRFISMKPSSSATVFEFHLLAVLSSAQTKLLSSNCLINTKNLSSAFCPLLCKTGDIIL